MACASVNKDWFTYTATSLFYSAQPGHDRTWRVDAITWSENNTEAIAGLHNKGRRAFALFDEASSIADGVWETIEGALTDAGTELFWLAFGNPTRTTGRFRECFAGGRFAHRWQPQQINSRSVSMTNKAQIATWVHDYGEDSDFVRVRVKGEFPRAGTMQFIDSERVQHAVARELFKDPTAALVMGVDIARQGEDQTVIRFRRGLDARSIPAVKFRIPDLMVTASRVMELVNSHEPDAVFVDGTGIGWGVVDRLSQLGCSAMRGVDFGSGADRTDSGNARVRYANKRAEMWGYMKEWCRFGCLPDDRDLRGRPHQRRVWLRRLRRDFAGAQARHAQARACLTRRRRCPGAHLRLSGGEAELPTGVAHPAEAGRPETANCMSAASGAAPAQMKKGADGALSLVTDQIDHLIYGHFPSLSGRYASSPGTVASSL